MNSENTSDKNQAKALNKTDINSRLIQEAILNDKQLRFLQQKRAKIITLAVPINYMDEDGNVKTEWLDEHNHPQLKSIEELIEFRTNQIIRHYS